MNNLRYELLNALLHEVYRTVNEAYTPRVVERSWPTLLTEQPLLVRNLALARAEVEFDAGVTPVVDSPQ